MLRSRAAEGRRQAFGLVLLLAFLLVIPPGVGHSIRGAPAAPRLANPLPAAAGPWTNLTPAPGAAPPAGVGAGLANDSAEGFDLWFGGATGSSPSAVGLTWTFNGTWSNRTGT